LLKPKQRNGSGKFEISLEKLLLKDDRPHVEQRYKGDESTTGGSNC